jgi:hypothetical protein
MAEPSATAEGPPDVVPPVDATALAREFASLKVKRDELEAGLDVVKARMAQIEPVLLDFFANHDMQSIKLGGVVVYVQRQIFASAADGNKVRAVRALRTAGLKELVQTGYNTNSISALFREMERDGVEPHPALRTAFSIVEKFSVRARKA